MIVITMDSFTGRQSEAFLRRKWQAEFDQGEFLTRRYWLPNRLNRAVRFWENHPNDSRFL